MATSLYEFGSLYCIFVYMAKKGRNCNLIELRNRKICERFTYWYGVHKVRLDETLRILSEEEFYLTERHIWRIIKEQKGLLSPERIKEAQKPKIKAVRGVPSRVKCVAEFDYSLFP